MSRRIFQFTWRSWVEAVLLFFSVGGLVQYGSTKGTNGNDRSQDAGLLRGYAQPLAPLAVDSTGFSVPADFPPVTNLCFWGIERGSNSVLFGLSWPEALSFTNAAIDLYGSARLASNGWTRIAEIDVSEALSNAVVEVPIAAFPTNAMEETAFFRLASQDDADGDGLSDAYERWVLGSDPLAADTDGDGLVDFDEDVLGTGPLAVDTDGDGLSDGAEVGFIVKSGSFEWYDTTGWTTVRADVGWPGSGGIGGWWCTFFTAQILSPHCVCGLPLSSVAGFEVGYVAFSSPGDYNGWIFPPTPLALSNDVWNSGSFMVAPYWGDMFLAGDDPDSCIRYGTATNGSFVVEFHDVRKSYGSGLGMTCQVIVPPGTGSVFRVSYLSSDWWLDGEGAVVGVQFTRKATPSGYYNLTWDFAERGPILPQTTIEFHLGEGTSPLLGDTDGDGLSDSEEVNTYGSDPLLLDTDGDGLSDGAEVSSGTNPLAADTDGDGLRDGWEIANGLDPLSGVGGDGANGDPDGDGLVNLQEQAACTDPNDADTDSDGLTDGAEVNAYCTNPLLPDTDGDGLSDGVEVSFGTNPISADTDGDGLRDGWEIANGLDPLSDVGDDGANGDPDSDGLVNIQEQEAGSDPNDVDTDGDGVSDLQELMNGSNPSDGADGGKPSASYPYRGMTFNIYGDYAAWQMTIQGIGPVDYQTDTVSMSSPGIENDKMKVLRKGNSYRLSMLWLNSDGHTDPYYWYCWQAKVNGQPTTPSYQSYTSTRLSGNEVVYGQGWLAENESGLLTSHVHAHDGAGGNVAEGLEAVLHIYKCEVSICSPDDETWGELDASRVILDDEDLRIRVRIAPAIATFDLCRRVMGSNICVKTSGTCPAGVEIPVMAEDFTVYSDRSEIRIAKTRQQLISLGLLPQNDDGVNEMAVYDVGTIAGNNGSDLSDSNAFMRLGIDERGVATGEPSLTLESSPPRARLSKSFLKAAGCEIVTVSYAGIEYARRQIMNQADILYYSGHGLHKFALLDDYGPSAFSGRWNKDLDCLIVSGCSILDINDYNNNFAIDPEDHVASPGKLWEGVGPNVMLGYNYYAPADEGGAPARIVSAWLMLRSSLGDVDAWMQANANNVSWNACAIIKNQKYVYFKKIVRGFWLKREILKNNW